MITNNEQPARDIMLQRQQMILDFIYAFRDAHDGISPTDREIAIGIGYSETSWGSVHVLVDDLVAQGWLKKPITGSRALIPTQPPNSIYYRIHTDKLLKQHRKRKRIARELSLRPLPE